MFAKALKGQNIEELLSNLAAAPVAAAGTAGPATDAPAAKVEKGKDKILFIMATIHHSAHDFNPTLFSRGEESRRG